MEEADPSREGILVVATEGRGITGFASFGPSRDSDTGPRVTGEVPAVYVDPDAWGTGAGRALMGKAVAELARLGYAAATLWVLDANGRARRFYAIAGWKERRRTQDRRKPRFRHIRNPLPQDTTGCV